jgi:hypothetical protein
MRNHKSPIFLLVFVLFAFCVPSLVLAGGVAAVRDRQTGAQRPALKGPNINLGRQKATAYVPPRTKSVNLPDKLPYEHVDEPVKEAPAAVKKAAPAIPSQVLTSSSGQKSSPAYQSPVKMQNTAAGASAPSSEMVTLFKRLDQSSELWLNISDMRMKALIVARYVDLYGQYGVQIRKPAIYYVNLIDSMAQKNPRMLTNPFDQVLRVVAILEYDYNSGEDKDALARSILDPQAFVNNKKRLGLR